MNTVSSEGIVFNIQRFSVHDGPGIRTTVFLKGCPLHCRWCHNPEGLSREPQVLLSRENCVHCGRCASVCAQGCHRMEGDGHRFDAADCIRCMRCVEACPYRALEACGERMSVGQVLEAVGRDQAFYAESGGGMTVSGGEPLMQPAFTEALLRGAGEMGIHRAIETSGAAPAETAARIWPLTDLVLLDWKHSDSELLREYTGARLEAVLSALAQLQKLSKPVILRCPVIPDVNDTAHHFCGIAGVVRQFACIRQVDIMPYHSLGTAKSARLGRPDSGDAFTPPSDTTVAHWIEELESMLPDMDIRRG